MTDHEPAADETAALRARISALSAASLRISASLDLETVLNEVVESARALTGARYGAIATIDEAGAAALSAGSARRSIGAPGHNDGRSRTPGHSRPGRTSAVGALRRSPSPPFRREGTTATRHGNLDPIRRCPFLPSAALNARPFYPGNMGE